MCAEHTTFSPSLYELLIDPSFPLALTILIVVVLILIIKIHELQKKM